MKNLINTFEKDDYYKNVLNNVAFQPIFIMGLHRSGTSILYKMLAETNCFNIVTAYHILNHSELLYNYFNNIEKKAKEDLTDFFKKQSQDDRIIDQLKINSDFPEEYGFLLNKKKNKFTLNQETLSIFIEFCKKIQLITKFDRPLLLKNPWDFLNFLYINMVFPNSKFIFIHRNPIKTLNSQIKMKRILLKFISPYMMLLSSNYEQNVKNKIKFNFLKLYNLLFNPILCFIQIKRFVNTTNIFLKKINFLNEEKYLNIRYEDLCAEPNLIILKIIKFLGLNIQSNINFNNYIKQRETKLTMELQVLQFYFLKNVRGYLKYYNNISK